MPGSEGVCSRDAGADVVRHAVQMGQSAGLRAGFLIKELPAEWVEHRSATDILNAPVA